MNVLPRRCCAVAAFSASPWLPAWERTPHGVLGSSRGRRRFSRLKRTPLRRPRKPLARLTPLAPVSKRSRAGRIAWGRTVALVFALDPICRCRCGCRRPSVDPMHLERLGMRSSRYRAADPKNQVAAVAGGCRACHDRVDSMSADKRGACRLPTREELRRDREAES